MIEGITKEQAIASLTALKGSNDWDTLVEHLKNDLKQCETDLCEAEYETIHDRNRDKDRRDILKRMLKAPEYYLSLYEQIPEKKEGEEESLDDE